ncbi:hypothetical protein FQZ97_1174220 [compost metagenome]
MQRLAQCRRGRVPGLELDEHLTQLHGVDRLLRVQLKQLLVATHRRGVIPAGQCRFAEQVPCLGIRWNVGEYLIAAVMGAGVVPLFKAKLRLAPEEIHQPIRFFLHAVSRQFSRFP